MEDDFSATVNKALTILASRYTDDAHEIDLRRTKYWKVLDEVKTYRTKAMALGRDMLSCDRSYGRFFGISLLGQVCNPVNLGTHEEVEADEIISWLSDMIDMETSVSCLSAIANTLGHPYRLSAEPALLKLSESQNNLIRWQATVSLGSVCYDETSPAVIARLLALSTDGEADIRDWATMHLGGIEPDNEKIRKALVARTKDRHFDTRSEAINALAVKGDHRGLKSLKLRLSSTRVGRLDIEAAGIYGLPELYSYLDAWQQWGYLYEWARKRCSSEPAVKDSVDDEWLGDEWYLKVQNGTRRPIKYKEWDGTGSPRKD